MKREHHGDHSANGNSHPDDHHAGMHKSPMQRDATATHTGYAVHDEHSTDNEHTGHHTEDFLKRFWLCLGLTIPVLLLSHMAQQWLGFYFTFTGDKYVLAALSSVIFFYGGWPFLAGMIRELRWGNPGMMTLVAVAITTAYLYSIAIVFGLSGMDFFWELATLIDIMLLGHWLEMKSQMAASKSLESLVTLLPAVVHVERDEHTTDIPLKELHNNDIIVIKPGEKVPADGAVLEGSSHVDESMLTGESLPVKKKKGEKLIGGTINGDGVLKVQVTRAGDDSYLNKVINLVRSAQGTKSNTQNLANKVAKWLTIISISVGIITFIVWLAAGKELSFALERMVTVMVTACPHALGVAVPLVVAISTSLSAIHGLLVRNRTAFENARRLTTIIFDKTGTLTKGIHEVQQVISLNNQFTPDQVLQYAAAIQQNSEHHIAHGIMRKLKGKNLELWKSTDFEYMQGMGVAGTVNSKKVVAAGPNYFRQYNLEVPVIPDAVNQSTDTVNFVLINNEPAGIITLADSIRETAAEAITGLRNMNIKSFLLTGDNEKVASSVARQLQMDGYLANVLPHEKQSKVKEFQDKGEVVAMTGDGINDAPALAQADVGIAVGSGTDVAAETADIILVNSDPKDVVKMIAFGRATYRKMVQNLVWAVGYNVVGIPLAAGILYPAFMLSPAMGAVLMSASTIIVAINAKLLKVK
ncbi:heavy metal translocating P-type ATPase [Paraflavitalea soli]|uniref:Heavy metal translocating P-type ATPase n=1 Tax=Paraflavitalea soli TaxID=2315862 RepID=A0A3B7MFT4_9BACT|nr:heavy metal translocating P-type ATPase [Paraflavitalea soli]AXY73194.1 heavy metal translocating P-type ATPase [Paraflavitalea soli]